MQPRSLDAILSELGSVYDPQVNSIRQRQSLIPQQIQAEEQGLQAKQGQAYEDILGGARRRGLGFAGIPLAEQAKYSATEYMPALARLRQSGREQAMSLEDAILGIQERRNSQGQQIYQYETSLAEQRRQFDEQQRLAREQAAAQQRAAASAGPRPTFGAPPSAGGKGPGAAPTNKLQQDAFNDVYTRMQSVDDKALMSDYLATASSAKYGNQKDLSKLQFYRQLRPDLFKSTYSWEQQGGLKAPTKSGGW